jgi:hypothetical protein
LTLVNFLDRLISGEIGASAFLATLLDPRYEHPIFVNARAVIARVLKQEGLELSSPAPTLVEVEYSNIDLVAVWSGWTMLIENKVAAASVTRGQLSEYYSASLVQLERRGFLKHAGEAVFHQPVCVIYLTPTRDTGVVEFNTLQLAPGRSDKKLHLGWNELLEAFGPVTGNANDTASWFFGAGVERIRKVLEAAKKDRLPEDGSRFRIQALMNELKARFQNSDQFSGLTFNRWSDQFKEQLFAAGPERSAYVGLYLSSDGTTFPSAGTIRAVGDISFDVASKHRNRLRALVATKSVEEWSTALGVPREAIRLNFDKGSLSWRFALPELSLAEFLLEMMLRVTTFLTVFRPIVAEAVASPAAQPCVAGSTISGSDQRN